MGDLKTRLRLVFGVDQKVCEEAAEALTQAEALIEELAGLARSAMQTGCIDPDGQLTAALASCQAWKGAQTSVKGPVK